MSAPHDVVRCSSRSYDRANDTRVIMYSANHKRAVPCKEKNKCKQGKEREEKTQGNLKRGDCSSNVAMLPGSGTTTWQRDALWLFHRRLKIACESLAWVWRLLTEVAGIVAKVCLAQEFL